MWVNLANDLNADYRLRTSSSTTAKSCPTFGPQRVSLRVMWSNCRACSNFRIHGQKGHAERCQDTGTLFGCMLFELNNDAPAFPQWRTNIGAIAQAALDNADQ